eukprot:symbB.v1.2.026525.t1/scaffold2656.1/size73803/3
MAARATFRAIQAKPAAVFHRRGGFVPCLVEAPQLTLSRDAPQWEMPHNVWAPDSLNGVRVTAMQPHTLADRMAYFAMRAIQEILDVASGFKFHRESAWLKRLQLLEMAATASQQSKQAMTHLSIVAAARGEVAMQPKWKGMAYAFGMGYLLWPRFGKWCVDHSQEALIRVYAELLEEMDAGQVPALRNMPAPALAIQHYGLSTGASLRDVIEKIHLDDRLLR